MYEPIEIIINIHGPHLMHNGTIEKRLKALNAIIFNIGNDNRYSGKEKLQIFETAKYDYHNLSIVKHNLEKYGFRNRSYLKP